MTACPALAAVDATVAPPHRNVRVQTPDGLTVAAQDWSLTRPVGPTAASRPGLLLLHGYSQSHRSWCHQFSGSLAQTFHLVTYDLRGHGDSDKPLQPEYYLEGRRWADEVRAVIEATRLVRPVVVAWSYAGRIVLDYLAAHGEAGLAGLVMAGASSSADPALLGPDARLLAAMTDEDPRRAHEATLAMLRACSARPLPADVLGAMAADNDRTPREVRRWLRSRPAHYEPVLESLTLPTLVIHGERDTINRPAMGRYTAEHIRGAKLLLYPDVGHMPFWEAPARFDADLSEFVQSVT